MVKDSFDILENRRILLVEDNPGDARLVEIYLRESPSITFSLSHVTRLNEGIELANKEKDFDIVLLDLSLPDSSGMETLDRAVEGFPNNVSIVVLTGVDDENFGVRAVETGAQDYLVKGQIDTSSLTRAVLHAIKRGQMQKQLEANAYNLQVQEQRLLQAQRIARIGNFEIEQGAEDMYWSDEVYRILGFDTTTVQPSLSNFLSNIPTQDQETLREKIKTAFEAGAVVTQEYQLFTEGTKKPKYVRIHAQLDDILSNTSYEVVKLIGTIQDISDYRNAQQLYLQTEKRYKTIFQESQDSIYITTSDGRFIEMNNSLIKLFGYSTEEEISQVNAHDLYYSEEQRKTFQAKINEHGAVKDFEVKLRRKNREVIDCLITSTKWRSHDGQLKGYHGIIRDITEQKRTQELIKAKEVAERSSKLKEQFLATMSHEIRTPMNVVVGMTHLLENTRLDNKQQEYINALKLSSDSLLRLINNILDFSKIEANKLELEQRPFKLKDLINEIVQTYKFKAEEKNIDLFISSSANLPDIVIGDSIRLHQILNNLVSNAIKYTNDGEIQLRTKIVEEDNQKAKIEFSVRDTGIGIPEEKLNTVFDSFTQASGETTRLYGGTGLGLSIVNKLVDLFKGTIKVKSEVGRGSTFTVVIPFPKSDGSEPVELSPSERLQSSNKLQAADKEVLYKEKEKEVRVYTAEEMSEEDLSIDFKPGKVDILLVEDHRLNQIVATDLLKKWTSELHLDIAENGKEAIEKLEKRIYDVILMDISMPVMDGYDTAEYIRNKMQPPTRDLPIIAMTAHAFNTHAIKCEQVGMNDFVSKPINPTVLYAKLNKILTNFGKTANKEPNTPTTVVDANNASGNINTIAPEEADSSNDNTINTPNNQVIKQEMEAQLIDLSYLDSLTGGDIDIKIMMVETIVNDFPTEVAKVENDYEQKDWDELKKSSHKIKSTCGYLGLQEMVTTAKTIENNSWERKELDQMEFLVQRLGTVCRKAHFQLKQELEDLKLLKNA